MVKPGICAMLMLVGLTIGYFGGLETSAREAHKTVRTGKRRCAAAWQNILQIPVGELAVIREPPIVVFKDGLRHLRYQPIPTAKQRRVTNLFAAPPPEATTTTTLPPGPWKPGGKP